MSKVLDLLFVPTNQFLQLKHVKPSCRVAIFSSPTAIFSSIYKGYILALTESKGASSYTWSVFSDHHDKFYGSQEEGIDYMRRSLASGAFDLVLSVGIFSTQIVKEATQRYFPDLPVIFCATGAPEQYGLINSFQSSGNNLVGVEANIVPEILYAKILVKLKPDIKTVLIPYRKEDQFRSVENSADRYKSYFDRFSVETILLPLSSSERNPLRKITNKLHAVDAVFLMNRAPIHVDEKILGRQCLKKNVFFVAGGPSNAEDTSAFCLTTETSTLGFRAGLLSKRILEENINPAHMHTQRIFCQRKVRFNEDVLSKHGVQLTDTMLEDLKEELLTLHKEVFSIPVLVPIEVNMYGDIVTGVCDHIRDHISQNDSHFYPSFCEMPTNYSFDDLCMHVNAFLSQRSPQGAPRLILAFGTKMVKAAQAVLKKRDKHVPIVAVLSQERDAELLDEITPSESTLPLNTKSTAYICIEKTPPLLPLECMQNISPTTKNILVLVNDKEPGFEMHKQQLIAYGEQKGISFSWGVVRTMHDIVTFCSQAQKEKLTILFYEEFLHMQYSEHLCVRAYALGIPLIGGGLESADKGAAISVGIDNKKAGGEVFSYMQRILSDNQSPADLPALCITDIFDVALNENSCKKQNIALSAAQQLLYKSTLYTDKEPSKKL